MQTLPTFLASHGQSGTIREILRQLEELRRALPNTAERLITPDVRGSFLDEVGTPKALTDPIDRAYVIDPPDFMSAQSDGETATIFLKRFTVKWGDRPAVGYDRAQIGNLDFNTMYHVFFFDCERDGTIDTCIYATRARVDLFDSPCLVYLGSIKTPPASGEAPTAPSTGGGSGFEPSEDDDPVEGRNQLNLP